MTEFVIREYKSEDVPGLKALWSKVFQDPQSLIDSFFACLPDMGSAVVAVSGGALLGAAYVITGMELINGDEKPEVCGYMYAVAVDEERRGEGIGEALVLSAEDLAKEREAELVCTLPAESSLYGWYNRLLGLDCVLFRRRQEINSRAGEPVMPLSSTEYLLWRELMLKGKPHLHPSNHAMEFERLFCECLGGGLFACSSGVCAAYCEGDTAVIKELVAMDEGELSLIAASVASELGKAKAVVYLPADRGEPYIAAKAGAIPKDCIWNLSFD